MTRRSLIALIIGLGLMAATMAMVAERVGQEPVDVSSSTFNTQPRGLRALYHALRDSGVPTRRWQRPYSELPEDAGVLVIAAPMRPVSGREWRKDLQPWVAGGRTLILASSLGEPITIMIRGEGALMDALEYSREAGPADEKSEKEARPAGDLDLADIFSGLSGNPVNVRPLWDTPATPDERSLAVLAFEPVYCHASEAAPLYATEDGPYVWHIPVEQGRVILTATPAWLSNAHVASADNLDFLLDVIGLWGGGREVLFDERAQGHAVGDIRLRDVFGRTAWGVGLAQLLVFGVWYAVVQGRRFGPVLPLQRDRPRSTLEYVDAMANLYRRAGLKGPALRALWRNFRVDVAKRYGIPLRAPVDVLSNEVLDAARPEKPAQVREGLDTVRDILAAERMSDRQLVRAVRALDGLREDVL